MTIEHPCERRRKNGSVKKSRMSQIFDFVHFLVLWYIVENMTENKSEDVKDF